MKSSISNFLNRKSFFDHSNGLFTTSDLISAISFNTKLSQSEFYLTLNGKKLVETDYFEPCQYDEIQVQLRVLGGKGGFGSMLRAIGAQIEKTTNREACRDLSGRRLRDINEEKRLKSWLDKQKDRDAEAKERKRKKLEKLTQVPKHEFKDSEYEHQRSELTEKLSDAVEEGFKNASSNSNTVLVGKRKSVNSVGGSKAKKSFWGDDESSSSDSDDDSDSHSDSEFSEKCQKSCSSVETGEGSSIKENLNEESKKSSGSENDIHQNEENEKNVLLSSSSN